ncbi:esterase [Geodermatophilus sp. DF01-2]|uniref:esterase n=1 Tax=Geodermatophilus sp. DF01-2 TaxID=2559610 RepID=UPI00107467D9|nr:esterase [Geodermatophilus sp. DF01_2]TFV58125.1 esterase [Geodermatophilus sp. DF01_2]
MSLHRNRFVHLAAATCLSVGAVAVTGTPALAGPPDSVQPPGRAEGHPPPGSEDWQPVQESPREPLFDLDWTIADPRYDYNARTGQPGAEFVPLTDEAGNELSKVLYGVHKGAAYRIEVPLDWNGDVVFWEHGYRGTGTTLYVSDPSYDLRRTYIENGYAWAASSYSANRYDIEAGVRSTEQLARLFDRLVGKADQRYLQGVSMGGHVIGVLLERNRGVEWAGAAPMCGVMGDRELYDFFLDYNLLAQTLAGIDAYPIPEDYVSDVVPRIKAELGTPLQPTPVYSGLTEEGEVFRDLITAISGGERPGDDEAFGYWEGQSFVYGVVATEPGGLDGVAPGAVWSNVDTDYPIDYTFDDGSTLDEQVERVAPAHQARRSGPSAYVPDITGDFDVPVLSIHTLGDYYVPFSMQQYYAADAAEEGNADLLVQRPIRAAGHCEFTPEEASAQFFDLVEWVDEGVEPAGVPVLDPEVVASPDYGCAFTTPARTGTRAMYDPCPVATAGD